MGDFKKTGKGIIREEKRAPLEFAPAHFVLAFALPVGNFGNSSRSWIRFLIPASAYKCLPNWICSARRYVCARKRSLFMTENFLERRLFIAVVVYERKSVAFLLETIHLKRIFDTTCQSTVKKSAPDLL